MSPGYDRDYIPPPNTIAYECMSCHNGYPRIPAGHSREASCTRAREGIDCQRCYGPGANHVRMAQTGAGSAAIRASIVNPKRLAPDRQMEVCMQCHLETTSLRLPHSVEKFGHGPFSYQPESLGNFTI